MHRLRNTIFAAVSSSLLLLVSCPLPITDAVLLHVKDGLAPTIVITSPEDGSFCPQTVVVTGTVVDPSTDDGLEGQVRSVTYEILATEIGGEIEPGTLGDFTFDFPTTNLPSTFVLRITATDWNGNSGDETITLNILDGDDIPSFTAKPGNGEVRLSWSDVPFSSSYTLFYTTNGTFPSESYGEQADDVSSPYTLQGLENGNRHVFLLKSNSSQGQDNLSRHIETIPLSPMTLAPIVADGFGEMTVQWADIPGTDLYEVWRSLEQDGTYINISGNVQRTWFTDAQVADGQHYYYKIRPALEGCPKSGAGFGQTDPFKTPFPYPATSIATTGAAMGIKIDGNYAYIADGPAGLQIVDITIPLSPTLLGVDAGLGDAFGVDVAGDWAYVADRGYGLSVFSVSDKMNPSRAGGYPYSPPGMPFRIDVDSNYAYIADQAQGLRIFYVPPGPNAFLRGTYDIVDSAFDVAVNGTTAYVAFLSHGLEIVDVSNRWGPNFVGNYGPSAEAVALAGDYAYVMTNGLVSVVDVVSDPENPSLVGSVALPVQAWGMTVSGDYAYVAGEGLHVIDISDPSLPTVIGSRTTPGGSMDVEVRGDYAFVADEWLGVQVFDVSQPDSPALGAALDTPGAAWGVALSGNTAFVAGAAGGFHSVDITNPAGPDLLDSWATPMSANKVVVRGTYAYLVDQGSGLQIFDITNPAALQWLGEWDTSGAALDVAVSGDIAFVAVDTAGVEVINVSVPTAPQLVASFNTAGNVRGIDAQDGLAFLADSSGLVILDVTNPSLPSEITTVDADPNLQGRDVSVVGDYAYVAYRSGGGGTQPRLQIIDISDPPNATEKGYVETVDEALSVSVRGNYAYVADKSGGVQVINVNIPDSPAVIATIATPDVARQVVVSGSYAYVADGATGLQIIDLQP